MFLLALIAILALVSLPTPSASQGDNTVRPFSYPPRVINSTQQGCPQDDVREAVRNAIIHDIRNATRNTIIPSLFPDLCSHLGQNRDYPAASCSEIPTTCSSGRYWVRSSNGTAVQVYCDLDRVCGSNSTRGWTRVINVNYTDDPSQPCPGEWFPLVYSTEPTRLCGRTRSSAPCVSALFSTYGIRYRHVCGRVIGFADKSPNAFGHGVGQSIEGAYVDGVSLTHGPAAARQHIWTFAAGLFEAVDHAFSCPCVHGAASPSYVGENYFCESGNSESSYANVLYASDPLWDGQGCGNPPCCDLDSGPPGMTAPWFWRQLPQDTSDDLEVRICGNQDTTDEDTPLQLVELYIR